jgi:quinol monooxygenase YgiN
MSRSAVRAIPGTGRFKLRDDELEQFKRLSVQLMETALSKDTGTVQYEIYFNDDQSECIVLERYRDSEALVEHAWHLGDSGTAIPGTAK